MVCGLESEFESENATARGETRRARRQSASAAVVSRPKKRQGKRLRSSRTTRDAMVWRSLNMLAYSTGGIGCDTRLQLSSLRANGSPERAAIHRLREAIQFLFGS